MTDVSSITVTPEPIIPKSTLLGMPTLMKPEIKELWVKDLLRPELKQTTHGLNTDLGWCVLGRLCDLHHEAMIKAGANTSGKYNWEIRYPDSNLKAQFYIGEDQVLPWEVIDWSGLDNSLGVFILKSKLSAAVQTKLATMEHAGDYASLTILNDAQVTFPELSEIIKTFL